MQPATLGVYHDPDKRKPFFPGAWPWWCIGRIDIGFFFVAGTGKNTQVLFNTLGQCTGTLIAPDLVLTAAHCMPFPKPIQKLAGQSFVWMKFQPAFFVWGSAILAFPGTPNPWAVAYAKSFNVFGAAYLEGNTAANWLQSGIDIAWDMAVIRLNLTLGDLTGHFNPIGWQHDWVDNAAFFNVGYPGAIWSGTAPSWQNWVVFRDDDTVIPPDQQITLETIEADLTPGNSGGPFFTWFIDDGPWSEVVQRKVELKFKPGIVGVASAINDYDVDSAQTNNVAAAGTGMQLLAAGAADLPI